MVLVDEWVSVGSCNFDHWNLHFNLEANVEALDPPLTAAVAASFERDFALSQEVDWHAGMPGPSGVGCSSGCGVARPAGGQSAQSSRLDLW